MYYLKYFLKYIIQHVCHVFCYFRADFVYKYENSQYTALLILRDTVTVPNVQCLNTRHGTNTVTARCTQCFKFFIVTPNSSILLRMIANQQYQWTLIFQLKLVLKIVDIRLH